MKSVFHPPRLLNMQRITHLQPVPKDMLIKISILKSMMYCGVLWGLYHPERHGWAIKHHQQDNIFPFWLNGIQAHRYAQAYWSGYVPRKINPADFHASLLPTLTRLHVTPALYNSNQLKFKLSNAQMMHFFDAKPTAKFAALA